MEPEKQIRRSYLGPILLIGVVLAGYYFLGGKNHWPFGAPPQEAAEAPAEAGPPTLELTEKQLRTIKLDKVTTRDFRVVKSAVGNVDFNQDLSAQVSTPYQGRILQVFVNLGDRVTRGQPLFSLESPDLIAAESTLIQTAGVLDLTNANLTRLRGATKIGGTAQKDLDQAISDQKTADGAYKSARLAMTVFGKTDAEIDQIAKERKVDPALIIRSPVDGLVSSRIASAGMLAQPGATPTPIVVSDDASMWLNAYVAESDAPAINVGEAVVAKIPAASDVPFEGKLTRVGGALDPNTHRLLARAQIDDPSHKLRAGMTATFEITADRSIRSLSVPAAGVVREGDGSMVVWVAKDDTHFSQRLIKAGLLQDGDVQILDGLQDGETVIVDGAIFVDNILNASPSD